MVFLRISAPRPYAAILLALACLSACSDPPTGPPTPPPAIILLIGDGLGSGAVAAARLAQGMLAMETLPVTGEVLTASASHDVTDSGAAATALATGVSTYNGAIGVGPDTVPVETVLERAESQGWATGLVVTSDVTHATPASFAAHVSSRTLKYDIAAQMASSAVDVLLGGGATYFTAASRPDGLDLLVPFADRGCAVHLEATAPSLSSGTDCLVALMAPGGLPAAPGREATLADLTELALAVLSRDPEGFFLMVEGSQIDWAAHENDGPWLVAEMADFDAAVAAALSFAAERPGTVVVVTADHETGGLEAGPASAAGQVSFTWTTKRHTAAPVPVFAAGVGADELAAPIPNDALGRLLHGILAELEI